MIKRELYLQRIRPFYDSDLIKVLIGIRRCGKSVLLRQIIDELTERGINSSHIIYLNFEDFENSYLQEPLALHQYITQIEDVPRFNVVSGGSQDLLSSEFKLLSELCLRRMAEIWKGRCQQS